MMSMYRNSTLVVLVLCAALDGWAGAKPERALTSNNLHTLASLPMSFEPNLGQADRGVKFLSRGVGHNLILTTHGATLSLGDKIIRMDILGANTPVSIEGEDKLPGTSNYFIGNDQSKWTTDLPTYARVRYHNVYPGIDLVFYGDHQQLEYDWILAPGADPSQIRTKFTGAGHMKIDADGDLVLALKGQTVRWKKPAVYQDIDGKRKPLEGRFVRRSRNEIGIALAQWDRSKPVIIDPVLAYSSYIGGSAEDVSFSIAVDTQGNAYITGFTFSTNFPDASTPPSATASKGSAFVMKINAAGTQVVYSTFLGGSNASTGNAIAVDANGFAYVGGGTLASNFPVMNSIQSYAGGEDIFVTKLAPAGNALIYSTFLGGSNFEQAEGLAIDGSGNVYITGSTKSTNFPGASTSPIQPAYGGGNEDAYVAKINSTGSAVVYATYLGGSGDDHGLGIAVDSSGQAYVTGYTYSCNINVLNRPACGTPYPTHNAFQPNLTPTYQAGDTGAQRDAFVSVINASGTGFVYSTYLGGDDAEDGRAIFATADGHAYVTGDTNSPTYPPGGPQSSTPFPTLHPYQAKRAGNSGSSDFFVTEFNPQGQLVYSTYFGGTGLDQGLGIAVDQNSSSPDFGSIFVGGYTNSKDIPMANLSTAPQSNNNGVVNVFAFKLSADGQTLLFSTYFGGSGADCGYHFAIDSLDNIYMTGWATNATNFPSTMNPPIQSGFGGPISSNNPTVCQGNGATTPYDGFIAKLANSDISLSLSSATGNGVIASVPDAPQAETARMAAGVHAMGGSTFSLVPGSSTNFGLSLINQAGNSLSPAADNPNILCSLGAGVTMTGCTVNSTNQNCLGTNNTIVPGQPSLPQGQQINLTVTVQAAPTAAVGSTIASSCRAQADTNDPNPSNNIATFNVLVTVAPPTIVAPLNNATNVPLNQQLSWNASTGAASYQVFFGTSSPPPPVTGSTTATSFNPGTLQPGVTYYWQVEAENGGANATSPIWSFTATSQCTYQVTPTHSMVSAGPAGGPGGATSLTATVTTAPGCGWMATTNNPTWLTITSGSSGNGNGTVTYSVASYPITPYSSPGVPGARNGSLTIAGQAFPVTETTTLGSFDGVPGGQTTGLVGDVNIGGWALSAITNSPTPVSVQILREPVIGENPAAIGANGLVFVENTTFIPGTRPDVFQLYGTYPNNNDSGWGAQLLTNELPNSTGSGPIGNGTFNFHALATDASGAITDLGTKTLTVNNASSVLPFGSIDTPAPGGVVSGNAYVNFGWVLTPQPANIPLDGSTITVFVDNNPVGHPTYGFPRSDIQSLFPGYANTNTAIGYFRIDSTKLSNGLHQISWGVSDSAGHQTGIGSRYFVVSN